MKKIKPMLATLVDKPFNDSNFIFEPKWDGFRAIAEKENDGVVLYSRNLLTFTHFGDINDALKKLPLTWVLDGEVVAEDEHGRPKFQLLQNFQRDNKSKLVYWVFDLLFLNHHDLRKLPLMERKKMLKKLLSNVRSSHIKLSPYIEKQGVKYFQEATKKGWEGIIAKQKDSTYLSDKRTRFWQKIKIKLRQEVVIIGFTQPSGSRKYLGSLILGVYDKAKLVYIGHAGTGFDEDTLKTLYQKLKPMVTKISPFQITPKSRTKAYWVKPKLVGEISFAEWTSEGMVRQTVFLGLRPDKSAKQVHKEKLYEKTRSGSQN